ncbi:hypothetical protein SRHO_G00160940 [Serrasalmus rhombeus]
MHRSFPAIYSNRTRTKRKAPEPPRVTKFLQLQFCLQGENTNRSPKDETLLLRAGLGRRSINISDDADHSEITRVLLEEYPKLQHLRGGWLLHKAAGAVDKEKLLLYPKLLPFHIESCQLDDYSRILDMLQENSQAKRLMLFVCMEEGRSSTKSSSAVQGLLHEKETEPPLKFRMDIREDVEDQEERIISFYKVPKVDWARPLYCKLEGNGQSDEELSEDQRGAVNQLALFWDLPLLTATNRTLLLHSLFQHAVFTQTSQQVKQLRQGLKESMMSQLLEARPDVVVLDNIIWPSKEETDNDDDGFPVPVKCRIAGYLWQFVETGVL